MGDVSENGAERKDVLVMAPAARVGVEAALPAAPYVGPEPTLHAAMAVGGASDAEIVGELARVVARLESEKRTLQTACSSMTTIALALVRMCLENDIAREDGVTVRVEKEWIAKATGGKLTVREDGGDILVRIARDGTIDLDFASEG
jgi:hypothetical protein